MQDFPRSGSISISSIGISTLPHQQPPGAETPQRFDFAQNGQRLSDSALDMGKRIEIT